MLTLLAIGRFFGGIGSFISKHWRIILPLAILSIALWYVDGLRAHNASLTKQLSDLKQSIALQTEARKAENAQKALFAKRSIEIINQHHADEIASLKLDRKVSMQKIKELYEKKIQTADSRTDYVRANFSERVQLDAERYRLASAEEPATSEHTEAERECYRAYSDLEEATAITTLDFNACSAWVETACATVGCEGD